MKEVTLKIPENRLTFFLELVEQLGFEVAEELEISEEHKAIVIERIKKSDQNPERLLDWDQIQDNFQLDWKPAPLRLNRKHIRTSRKP